nr:hypothetical protein [Candidatus Sigynarchaeota archaeon]
MQSRIGKPAATEGGLRYFYVRAMQGGVVNMLDGTPRLRMKSGDEPWLYEPSKVPDREERCPGCGAQHPLIMECRAEVIRLFVMCDKHVPSKIHVIYDKPDERESTIGSKWLNHPEPIPAGKIGAWLRGIQRIVHTT